MHRLVNVTHFVYLIFAHICFHFARKKMRLIQSFPDNIAIYIFFVWETSLNFIAKHNLKYTGCPKRELRIRVTFLAFGNNTPCINVSQSVYLLFTIFLFPFLQEKNPFVSIFPWKYRFLNFFCLRDKPRQQVPPNVEQKRISQTRTEFSPFLGYS